MKKMGIWLLAILLLVLPGLALAAPGEDWGVRGDGRYAPSKLALEVKDYSIIFSKELAADKAKGWQAGDDTIATASWVYAPGITGGPESKIADPQIPGSSNTGVQTWLAGGTSGQKYTVTITLVTTMGRTLIFPWKIEVK